jgi:hypothetical protein
VRAASNPALTCIHGKIKIPTLKKTEIETSDYCYDLEKWILLSPGCTDRKKGTCILGKSLNSKRSTLSKKLPEFGTPGAAICKQIGGKSQVIEFEAKDEWQKLNRCLMAKDGSFADLATLFRWSGP